MGERGDGRGWGKPWRSDAVRARGAVSLLLVFLFSGGARAAAQEQAKVTYDDQVQRLLGQHCGKCHGAERQRAGLDLSTYAGVLKGSSGGTVVEAGDPAASTLYLAITHQREPTMPPGGGKLAESVTATIRAWIAGGLLENSGSKARAKRKSGLVPIAAGAIGRPAEPLPLPEHLSLEPAVVTKRPGTLGALAANPWASLVALGGQKQVLLYDSRSFELRAVLPFPEGQPAALAFTSDGRLLVAGGGRGGDSGKAVVWNVADGERVLETGDEPDVLLAADLSADRSLLLFGGPQRVVKLVDAATGAPRHLLKKHTEWLLAARFSPDGVLLASGDRNGGLAVFEAQSGREMHTLVGHTAAIKALAWRDDSNVLASVSEDGTLKLWEMFEGRQVKSFAAHGGGALSVAMAHDGRLASGGRDRAVKVWDAEGQLQRSFELPAAVVGVAFDDEGTRLIAGDAAGEVGVWSLADGARLATLALAPPTIATRLALAAKRRDDALAVVAAAAAARTTAEEAASGPAAAVALALADEAQAVAAANPFEQAVTSARAAADAAAATAQAAAAQTTSERAAQQERAAALAGARHAAELATAALEPARVTAIERAALADQLAVAAATAAAQAAAASSDAAIVELAAKAAEAATLARAAADAAAANVDRLVAGAAELQGQLAQLTAAAAGGGDALAAAEAAEANAAAAMTRRTEELVAGEQAAAGPCATVAAARQQLAAALAAAAGTEETLATRRRDHEGAAAVAVAAEREVARWRVAEFDHQLASLRRDRRGLEARRAELDAGRTAAVERQAAAAAAVAAAEAELASVPERAAARANERGSARQVEDERRAAVQAAAAGVEEKRRHRRDWQREADELNGRVAGLPADAPLVLAAARLTEAIALLDRDLQLAEAAVDAAQAAVREQVALLAALDERHAAAAEREAALPAEIEQRRGALAATAPAVVESDTAIAALLAELAQLDQRIERLTQERDAMSPAAAAGASAN